MSNAPTFKRFFATTIDNIHIIYWCPYCRSKHSHGSCNDFCRSRSANRSSHCSKKVLGGGNVDVLINLDTKRRGLNHEEKLEWKRYKAEMKRNNQDETKFFLDDYLKMMKFYSKKWKKDKTYSIQRLQKDWCDSGLSKYETNDAEGKSINWKRYEQHKIFSDILLQ